MNYLAHPHKTASHVASLPFAFDFSSQHAVVLEGSEDAVLTWTAVQDIAGVVARAIEYKGEWPAVGGIAGSPMTIGSMLKLGESIGKLFSPRTFKDALLRASQESLSRLSGSSWRILKPRSVPLGLLTPISTSITQAQRK